MNELDESLHEQIKGYCASGDTAALGEKFDEAIKQYEAAWTLLPSPKMQWQASVWILAALGDACFLSGQFERGKDTFQEAMHGPSALGNPFLHLRLGQCQLELGFDILAGDELTRAYMAEGTDIFRGEDPKYFKLIQGLLQAPPGGWQ